MMSMICIMIFKKTLVVIYMLIYMSIILLKNVLLYISKYICKLLIKYAFSKDVKHWLIKEEIDEMENNNPLSLTNFDNGLICRSQKLICSKVSSPGKMSHPLPSNQIEIKLLSVLLDNRREFDIKRLQGVLIEGLFYCITNKRIPYSKLLYDAFRKHQCHVWHHCVQLLPIFLLLDSPKEAYESMVDNTRHFPIADLTHWDVLYSVLRNGRRKKVESWDLKVLAAYIKAYKFFFFSLSVYDKIAIQQ